MSKRGARQVVFVCASLLDNQLITKILPANSPDEARELFAEQYHHTPKEILGPFFKKRTQIIDKNRVLKFSNQTKKAIYGDWIVNAILLVDPIDQAYLVFTKRVDGKKMTLPRGIITAPVSDLKFIDS